MGGNMKVRSPVAGEALIPSGAWWHIDASATNLMTLTSVDDELRVKKWTDSGEGDYVLIKPSSSANTNPFPKLKLNALGGRPVVDFGPFMLKTAYNNLPSLRLTYRQERGVYKKGLRTAVTVMGSAQGGCSIVGETDSTSIGYNNGYGVQRGGSYGASPSDPIIINSYSDHPSYLEPNAVRVRTNGVSVVGTSTGLSGGYDLVTFAAYDSFGTGALAMNHYCQYAGGQEVAESFYYERGLSTESIEGLEAYLRKKWFGVDTPGYRPATAASLTVDAGASFEVVGGESMKVALLSGGGSVSGSLVLADNGVLEVPVAADGSVGTLSVSGDVDLSGGGVVRLTGFQRALRGGEYVLVRAGTISAGSGEWTVTGTALRSGCEYSVRVEAGSVVLVVRPLGAVLIVL